MTSEELRQAFLDFFRDRDHPIPVSDVMQTDFQTLDAGEMLDRAFRRLQECQCSTAPVSFQGRLVGLVTMDNIGEFMAIQGALNKPRAG